MRVCEHERCFRRGSSVARKCPTRRRPQFFANQEIMGNHFSAYRRKNSDQAAGPACASPHTQVLMESGARQCCRHRWCPSKPDGTPGCRDFRFSSIADPSSAASPFAHDQQSPGTHGHRAVPRCSSARSTLVHFCVLQGFMIHGLETTHGSLTDGISSREMKLWKPDRLLPRGKTWAITFRASDSLEPLLALASFT